MNVYVATSFIAQVFVLIWKASALTDPKELQEILDGTQPSEVPYDNLDTFDGQIANARDLQTLKEQIDAMNMLGVDSSVFDSDERPQRQRLDYQLRNKRPFCNGFYGCGRLNKRLQSLKEERLRQSEPLEEARGKRPFCNGFFGCRNGKRSFSAGLQTPYFGSDDERFGKADLGNTATPETSLNVKKKAVFLPKWKKDTNDEKFPMRSSTNFEKKASFLQKWKRDTTAVMFPFKLSTYFEKNDLFLPFNVDASKKKFPLQSSKDIETKPFFSDPLKDDATKEKLLLQSSADLETKPFFFKPSKKDALNNTEKKDMFLPKWKKDFINKKFPLKSLTDIEKKDMFLPKWKKDVINKIFPLKSLTDIEKKDMFLPNWKKDIINKKIPLQSSKDIETKPFFSDPLKDDATKEKFLLQSSTDLETKPFFFKHSKKDALNKKSPLQSSTDIEKKDMFLPKWKKDVINKKFPLKSLTGPENKRFLSKWKKNGTSKLPLNSSDRIRAPYLAEKNHQDEKRAFLLSKIPGKREEPEGNFKSEPTRNINIRALFQTSNMEGFEGAPDMNSHSKRIEKKFTTSSNFRSDKNGFQPEHKDGRQEKLDNPKAPEDTSSKSSKEQKRTERSTSTSNLSQTSLHKQVRFRRSVILPRHIKRLTELPISEGYSSAQEQSMTDYRNVGNFARYNLGRNSPWVKKSVFVCTNNGRRCGPGRRKSRRKGIRKIKQMPKRESSLMNTMEYYNTDKMRQKPVNSATEKELTYVYGQHRNADGIFGPDINFASERNYKTDKTLPTSFDVQLLIPDTDRRIRFPVWFPKRRAPILDYSSNHHAKDYGLSLLFSPENNKYYRLSRRGILTPDDEPDSHEKEDEWSSIFDPDMKHNYERRNANSGDTLETADEDEPDSIIFGPDMTQSYQWF